MKNRCNRPSHCAYSKYGGRGVTVCPEWDRPDGFIRFLEDMGPLPQRGWTLERIDVNGGYKPSNCRWASRKEQARNRRDTLWLEALGERKSRAEWLELLGVTPRRLSKLAEQHGPTLAIVKLAMELRPDLLRSFVEGLNTKAGSDAK